MEKGLSYKLRKGFAGVVLVAAGYAAVLSGCCKRNSNKSKEPTRIVTETPVDTITPTIEATPTDVVVTETPTVTEIPTSAPTPTDTPIPTPTETPVPTATPIPPEPTPKPEERGIAYDDLTLDINIENDYFGEEEDFETEFAKRKQYFESFGIKEDLVEAYLVVANMDDILGDTELTEKYKNKLNFDTFEEAISKFGEYNFKHGKNQAVLSFGFINANYDRNLVINTIQRDMYDGMVNKKYTAKIKSCTTSSIYYVKDTGVSKSLSYKDLSDLENLVVNTYIWEPFKSIPANSRPAEAQQAIYSSKGAADVFKNNIKEALKQKTKGLK